MFSLDCHLLTRRLHFRVESRVSTTDERYPVDNIINNTEKNITKKWLSSPFDKSRRLEAEFQLECASYIHYVDIGNSGSCSVELHVGNSSWQRTQPYVNLLPSVSFMTFADIKAGASPCGVKMFNKKDMNQNTHHQKYDRIRVICHQPYMKPLQFGLCFLILRCSDIPATTSLFDAENFYSKAEMDSLSPLSEKIGTPRTQSFSSFHWNGSRGHKMVDLALGNVTTTPKRSEKEDLDDFEMKVMLFITSKDADGMEVCLNACQEQFEERNMISLNPQQKTVFEKVYHSVFARLTSSRFSAQESRSTLNTLWGFNSPKNYSNIRRTGNKRLHRSDSPVTAYDVDFLPKRSRISETQSFNDDDVIGDVSIPSHIDVSSYVDDNSPPVIDLVEEDFGANSSFYRADDFVQFDGSVPSTSKDTSYVNCPICSRQFHVSEIETHAASCEDFAHANPDDSEDDDMNSSTVLRPKNMLPRYHLTKC